MWADAVSFLMVAGSGTAAWYLLINLLSILSAFGLWRAGVPEGECRLRLLRLTVRWRRPYARTVCRDKVTAVTATPIAQAKLMRSEPKPNSRAKAKSKTKKVNAKKGSGCSS